MLRIGVIGLGRLWRKRYGPALRRLHGRFEIRAVYDQVRTRAEREAARWRCPAVAGPTALLENPEVEALLMLDDQWFRLWPLEVACRVGKPVFCCGSLELEGPRADGLVHQVRDSRLPVMVAMAPRCAPAVLRLRELLATELGQARLVLCDAVRTCETSGEPAIGPDGCPGLGSSNGIALVDACVSLLGGEPVSVLAAGADADGFASLTFTFGDGRAVQVNCRRTCGTSRLRLEVSAEHGSAGAELPGHVHWSGPDGKHVHVLRRQPVAPLLLEQFHDAITTGQPPVPNLEDAYRILGWLRAAGQSRAEGRRVDLR